jgi:hypothetical protein
MPPTSACPQILSAAVESRRFSGLLSAAFALVLQRDFRCGYTAANVIRLAAGSGCTGVRRSVALPKRVPTIRLVA